MEKNKIEEYIQQLTLLNNSLTDDTEEIDPEFENTLNQVLQSLTNDVEGKSEPLNYDVALNLKVMKLTPNAVLPSYSKDGDAGLDLTSLCIIKNDSSHITYSTGLSFEIPKGYIGIVLPTHMINHYDLFYNLLTLQNNEEILLTFFKTNGNVSLVFNIGENIGRLIIIKSNSVNLIEN